MARSGLTRLLIVAIAGAVVALSLMAVRSTGALWTDRSTTAATAAKTGQLSLVAGSGSGSTYQFTALAGTNIVTGQASQAPLAITNAGSTPLRYRLNAAGPQVTVGSGVTVSLSGTVMAAGNTCGTGTLPGTTAFTTFASSAAATAATSAWRSLPKGATETWCIRSTLQAVTAATGAATYTVLFTFGTEQTRS